MAVIAELTECQMLTRITFSLMPCYLLFQERIHFYQKYLQNLRKNIYTFIKNICSYSESVSQMVFSGSLMEIQIYFKIRLENRGKYFRNQRKIFQI